ncbi:MAG: hypothetical protein LBD97_00970 [Bifidobacteriaceae bacterium]|nr:hypothetical protein [Bifidobacteriaceae bacterium]
MGSCPAVMLTAGSGGTSRFPCVDFDQDLGARLAVGSLADLGHQVVAHFAGPEVEFHAQCRERGWRGALEGKGLRPGPLLRGSWESASGC